MSERTEDTTAIGDDTAATARAAQAFHRAVCAALDLDPDRRGVRKLICDALGIQMARYGQALLASRGSIGSLARWVHTWNTRAADEGLPTFELVGACGWEIRVIRAKGRARSGPGTLRAEAAELRNSTVYQEPAAAAAASDG